MNRLFLVRVILNLVIDQCIYFQPAQRLFKSSEKQTILVLISAGMGVSLLPASIRNICRADGFTQICTPR